MKYLLLLLFSTTIFTAQEIKDDTTQKIDAVLSNYFDLEREAIHLQLNKTDFLTNEMIWFKGYLINRKTQQLYFTTNVFVVLFDENGQKIEEQLVFGYNGFFQGNFTLDKKTHSGRYFIQVYTNWMNNFSENESIIREVNIINPKEGYKVYNKINLETLTIKINPEGGHFIKDIINNVGIEVSDCNGNRAENLQVELTKENGEVVSTFNLNRFGLGKIAVTPSNERLKFVINTPKGKIESFLPNYEETGIGINLNPLSNDDKTLLKINTNSQSIAKYYGKKLKLIIHQDQNFIVVPLAFNEQNEQIFTLKNNELNNGVNTLRIIDEDLNEIAYRLFYCNKNVKNSLSLNKVSQSGTQIKIKGIATGINEPASIGMSSLPNETKSNSLYVPIIAGLTINPYLENPLKNANYFFNTPSRAKSFELDLELLNQNKLKYNFNTMKVNAPKANYSFDIGLTLKGKVNNTIKDLSQYKVKALSYVDLISKISDLNAKGEYTIENIVVEDSTYMDISLVKIPNLEKLNTQLTPQILNRNRPFYKNFTPLFNQDCPVTSEIVDFDFPKFKSDVINLKEVVIENKKETKLKYQKQFGNANLRSFKIEEKDNYITLLQFIERNGFVVTDNGVAITIRAQNTGALSLNLPPPIASIFIDNRELLPNANAELYSIQMNQIDEIYLRPQAIVAGMNNRQGIIKIYMKEPQLQRDKSKDGFKFFIEKGFQKTIPYSSPDYNSTLNEGFQNFGAIAWQPNLFMNKEGEFEFEIDDYNLNEVKIIIEGFSNDGKILYEEKLVKLK